MPFDLRLAWREIRPAFKRFVFMILAIGIGVGALTGIKGFSSALDRSMARSARDLIAADLSLRTSRMLDEKEQEILNQLVEMGAQRTDVTETLSMASIPSGPQPVLVTVKAVDPEFYPFYGSVGLEPVTPLRQALLDDAALVSQEFLIRTGSAVGGSLQIGSGRFRIAAVLKSEPDRLASGVEMGPRIMISRKGLEQTGLIQFGSRASRSFLFRLPAKGLSLEEARGILRTGFPRGGRISDYREPTPGLSRELNRMTNFLSLIGLLSLLVGGLGVAMTIHAYLQQKLDTIAILKCLGGRSRQIMRLYLIQGLLIGVLGSLLGVALGYVVQLLFPRLLKGLLEIPTELELAPGAAVQGFLIGMLTTLLFLLPPLLAIRKVRPSRVFLREMPETHFSVIQRLRRDPLPLALTLVLLTGVGAVASWLANSWKLGFTFLLGLAGAILILTAAAKLLLAGLRRTPRPPSLVLRYGLRNLYRPGNHVASVLVALGIGVAFTMTVYLVQTSLLPQIWKTAPRNFPNVFLLGITERDKGPLWELLRKQPGIVDANAPVPVIPARLQAIDGKTADQLGLDRDGSRYFQIEFVLTWNPEVPPDTTIIEGKWWSAPYEGPLISVGQNAARNLHIGVGTTLEFLSSGQVVRGKVANIRDTEFSRPGTNNQFIFSPGALDGLPASYVGNLRVAPDKIVALQSAVFARFPNVTSIDVGHILTTIQNILDKVSNIIRFVTFFAIAAGVIILASSIATTRYQRIREAALLKTLGATRGVVARIHAAEFLIIGLVAGMIGCLLAAAAADYLLGRLLETEFKFQWLPMLAGTLATAALTISTGWLASRGVLNHKPLEVLREN
jgi:putative ABC transport system permease protein